MGYDVHITRRREWHDQDGPEISLAEWTALVDADPEMRLDGVAEASTPAGDVLRVVDPGMAVWTACSGHGVDGNMAWIWHFEGNVTAKNPDAEISAKMWRLAQSLGARVQGDESEHYGADGEALPEDTPVTERAGPQGPDADALPASAARRPWWRLW